MEANDSKMSLETPAIHIEGLTKNFGAFRAINRIDISVGKGEVHALVGQNGAGKSTLMGILSGRIAPTEGKVEIFGTPLVFGDPRYSKKLGISIIYQELTIAPNLTAAQNVFLGQTLSKYGFVMERAMERRFKELCGVLGVDISAGTPAKYLSVAQQQMVEIMRGLQSEARILILDEPTASLAPPERESLLQVVDNLRASGISVIYTSHHLDEVLQISDKVTILRNGERIATEPKAYWNKENLVGTMLGEEGLSPTEGRKSSERGSFAGDEILKAEITVPGVLDHVEITLRAGEVLGIGGLVGSGRSTLVRALAGGEPAAQGTFWLDGKKVRRPKSPADALRYGIALAPEDRKHQGLVLGMSCVDNINLINFKQVKRFGFFRAKEAVRIADGLGRKFGLTRPIHTITGNLSGGNQQKVLLSKVCNVHPRILLIDEPTRGIDIGVKREVMNILRELAQEGMAIIVISSELEEVVEVSDRVVVLSKGRKVKELQKEEISVGNILNATFREGAV
jgi:ABC-type sugar transport system ATPase subunit